MRSLIIHLVKQRFLVLPIFVIGVLLGGCSSPPELEIKELDPDQALENAKAIEEEVSVDLADDLEINLWASEELAADPVGMDIDDQGNAYITVTNRTKTSEFDIRGHTDWMSEAMTWQTVEDRRDFLHEELSPDRSEKNEGRVEDYNEDGSHDWRDLTIQTEDVVRIEDRSGDGVADFSQLYISDFHDEVTDVAGAILSYDGKVYVGVAPDMWLTEDTNDDGMADEKESISHGYAVHMGFSGHGMSGATMGPDGKLYWGIGDIGANIEDTEGNKYEHPHRGVVVRSNPDGSDFEVFAHGVRNTFEFDFDKYGNLISVDNDGDHAGEEERLVYLIDGSDSGWRINWQFGKYTDPKNNEYKVWMDEDYYKPRHEGQSAHILPPIQNYYSGPAGMAYNPGTALSEKWEDHFFFAEFPGSASRARIHGFKLEEVGAGFELEREEVVQQGILATSIDFGPDGALYFADWIEGWDTKDEGRIWRIDAPEAANSEIRQETEELLGDSFADYSEEELSELLQHKDMRIRTKAQFELVERGDTGSDILLDAIRQTDHQLARIHGIWGIGQLAREDLSYAEPLIDFLEDDDPEIRAQLAKVIGEAEYQDAADPLIDMLEDDEARPKFFAAQALGQLKESSATQPIVAMLEENDDEDVYLRTAGSLALARIDDSDAVTKLSDHSSRAVRLAAVVALKRMEDPDIAEFLDDEDEYIVTDAARAINDDEFIEDAMPALAMLLEQDEFSNEPLIRRAINANLQLGESSHAERVAEYATNSDAPEALRVDAIEALGVWPEPSIFDRVTGEYRGERQRDSSIAVEATEEHIEELLQDDNEAIRIASAHTTGQLQISSSVPTLHAMLENDPSTEVRMAALEGLYEFGGEEIENAINLALNDAESDVRMKAIEMIPTLDISEDEQAELLATTLEDPNASSAEKQTVLETLGDLGTEAAADVLETQLNLLVDGDLDEEIQLDLIEAVEAHESGSLAATLDQYMSAKEEDSTEEYSETLYGGNAERGQQIFYQNSAAQCIRCHAVDGEGGDVGPDLTDIGSVLTREQLLESLIDPGARIAPGYGSISYTLEEGETVRGIVQEEDEATVTVQDSDGQHHEIEKDRIEEEESAPSSMPPMGTILSRSEIRDLIEFMSTLEE